MKENRKDRIKNYKVLGLLLVYLFVVLSNIFFLAPANALPRRDGHSKLSAKIENVQSRNLLERADKAIFKGSSKRLVSAVPVIYLSFLLAQPKAKALGLKAFLLKNRSFSEHRYSYLSLCTFRV